MAGPDVASAPEPPMRGDGQQYPPPGFQPALPLLQRRPVILDVLQHLERQDEVKRPDPVPLWLSMELDTWIVLVDCRRQTVGARRGLHGMAEKAEARQVVQQRPSTTSYLDQSALRESAERFQDPTPAKQVSW